MTYYLATRCGITSRVVLGVFSTEAIARAACEAATQAPRHPNPSTWDGDGYHVFVVAQIMVDVPGSEVEIGRWMSGNTYGYRQARPCYTWRGPDA